MLQALVCRQLSQSRFPPCFPQLVLVFGLRGESKKIQKTRDGHQYFICCSNARFWTSFQQLSVRLTTYVHMNAALLGGFLMSPVWVSNLFTLQFRKARMSLWAFRPKPMIGKVFAYKHCFCFCFFHTPRVSHTPRFPYSQYPVPGPWPRVFDLAETATILPAALRKFLAWKRTFVTLFGMYELIKLVSSRKGKVKSQNPTFLLHGQ